MEYVDVARAASERGEVVLRGRRTSGGTDEAVDLELRVNGVFVMDTRETSTERALARVALHGVATPEAVLVAGLGLGYTAHEVLADPRVGRVVVVELEDALVGWMRDGTVPHGPALLADARLQVVTADIRQALCEAHPASYDLVVLDVDNGPGFLVHETNAGLYGAGFLHRVHEVLRPGGAVAVWSMQADADLHTALASVFGAAVPVPLDVRLQDRAEQYWLYLAHRAEAGEAGEVEGR